ncbi:DUF3570 domain-containing protein [Spirosoma radiotolerans]|uniref:DUF3570 domain-containing protein n=1 Tax=Spirosoma radiotolerans TaxID=1379870 RepID=A0A0E3V7G2_9BACT|nr:DUF3570 domain-containing protein [Spirosoma radiotolerans]AKD55406.1 hypothetical protein SD10_11330 [Spirosoma radiotolerans]
MKKICLSVGLLLSLMRVGYTQPLDKPPYEPRKLKVDEINLVSSYYQQDGNKSAVTGGIGTEYLTDFAQSIDLVLKSTDAKNRQHSLAFDLNIDHYTSASSDKIDPLTVSSASRSDTHIYPSVSWSVHDNDRRTTQGVALSYSTEYDYKSYGVNVSFAKASADNNREVSLKAGAFFDTWKVILPAELRPEGYGSGAHGDTDPVDYKPRNSYNVSLSLSQVINKRLQVLFTVEPAFQQGLLSTPFHRIYFQDGAETVERLPGSRLKLPIGLRLHYFMGDRLVVRTFYRYYIDDWGMQAHTINLETPIKLTSFVSVSPFYRFSHQTAVRYFSPYGEHRSTERYYTSDYDISGFNSQFIGTGIRLAPPGGLFGIGHWQSVELRYGHYTRTTGMVANSLTLLAKLK